MPTVKVLVTLNGKSGDPKDRYVNTWHFTAGDTAPGSADIADIFNELKNFYGQDTEQVTNAQPAGQRNVLDYVSDGVASGAVHTMRFYDVANPAESPPVFTGTFSKTDNAAQLLPGEVAVVLSLKAPVPNGTNVQRGRGRLYIGPLNIRALAADSNDARVALAFRQVLAKALVRLVTNTGGSAGLVVRSTGARAIDPATGRRATGTILPAVDFGVTSGFVDDAFDTQRRRGGKPTSRTLITLP